MRANNKNRQRRLQTSVSAIITASVLCMNAWSVVFAQWPIATQEGDDNSTRVGDLTGRVIVRGNLPAPKPIGPIMPRTGKRITDDSIVVSGRDQALANLFVYMSSRSVRDLQRDGIVPEPPKANPIVVGIVDGHIIPRALCVRDSQRLIFRNADDETCVIQFDPSDIAPELVNERSRLVIAPSQQHEIKMKRVINYPGLASSQSHGWLRCDIMVNDHPYAAITDLTGRFTIKNIPIGQRIFSAWHERSSNVEHAFIKGNPVEWRNGKIEFTIGEGVNDVGTIEIPAEAFGG